MSNGADSKQELLKQAVEAGRNKEPEHARGLLLQLLYLDNREPLYWLLMSTAVESREEQIYCLKNVLLLDPENSAAIHDLKQLGVEVQPVSSKDDSAGRQEWHTANITPPVNPKRPRRNQSNLSLSWVMLSLGIGVIIIAIGYYTVQGLSPETMISTTGGINEFPGEKSLQYSATPLGELFAAQELSSSDRDPQSLLAATYTPTPRYIATPHSDNNYFARGLTALDNEDWLSAADLFQSYLLVNPQSPDAVFYLGLAYLGAGDLEAAQAAFETSLAGDPEFAPAYLGRARVFMAQNADSSLILTDLNSAILLDANFVEAYLERAAYRLSRGNIEGTTDDVAAAEAIAPLSALVQYQKALVLLAEKNYLGALQASQRAYELDLTLMPNYLALAEAQQGVQQYTASIETMQIYLSFQEDARGWELLGLGYQFSGQGDLALEAFDHALALDPNSPQAAYYRGLQELVDANPQDAFGHFQVTLAALPDWFEARIGLARAYLGTGNPSGAFLEVNASSNLAETDQQRAAFFYWRATILEALGQSQTALADWRSLLNLPAPAVPAEWREIAKDRIQ